MAEPLPATSFALMPYFLEFHAEVQRLRRLALQDAEPGNFPRLAGADREFIQQRLQALLENQALIASRRLTDAGFKLFREAQYVMVALADDVFLYATEWRGREAWREDILEDRVFQSRFAGERIFDNIDELLRGQDRRRIELAPIYILALSLGFKGRLRGPDHAVALDGYRRRLFQYAFARPADAQGAARPLIPAAYAHLLANPAPRGAGFRLTWPMAVVAVILAYVLIGEGLWTGMTHRLDNAISRVAAVAAPGAR